MRFRISSEKNLTTVPLQRLCPVTTKDGQQMEQGYVEATLNKAVITICTMRDNRYTTLSSVLAVDHFHYTSVVSNVILTKS